uniref:Uncharacterized protein n=1 Tax=Anguilla anguilla TaxID=7936 RepID=A0A0E9XDW3_ANGAN
MAYLLHNPYSYCGKFIQSYYGYMRKAEQQCCKTSQDCTSCLLQTHKTHPEC